nr:DUF3108 domain-containing protein [Verrucomicrobiota bacterium]
DPGLGRLLEPFRRNSPNVIFLTLHDWDNQNGPAAFAIFPDLFSLDAAILFLRSRPLTDGAVYRVVVYPENSAYLCTITVSGHENITVAPGPYRALKLDVQLSKVGPKLDLLPHKKFRNASVWLSDDNDRLILRIEAQVYIGSVFAELRSVQWDDARP